MKVTKSPTIVSSVTSKQHKTIRREQHHMINKVWDVVQYFQFGHKYVLPNSVFKKFAGRDFSAYDLYVHLDRQLNEKGWSWKDHGVNARRARRWVVDHDKPIVAYTYKTYKQANDITNLKIMLEGENASKNSIYNGNRYICRK